jgi:hypothetical protein
MKLHAIQTGTVRIKTVQIEGRGHGLARRLAVVADRDWIDWLPTYVWAIDHPEGVIVVDTGQGAHLLAYDCIGPRRRRGSGCADRIQVEIAARRVAIDDSAHSPNRPFDVTRRLP